MSEHATETHTGDGWGDYNAKPPLPSTLPAISPLALLVLGGALAAVLATLVSASFTLATAREPAQTVDVAAPLEPHAKGHEVHE